MIEGLCESPLTFQAIIIWRDQLADGEILLRDIIDLEATYAGPDAKQAAPVMPSESSADADGGARAASRAAKPAPRARAATRKTTTSPRSRRRRRTRSRTTTTISRTRCRCRRWKPSSSRRWSRPSTASPKPMARCARCRTSTPRTSSPPSRSSSAEIKKLEGLRVEVIADVKSLSLNTSRIESLVEQLYDINKRLVRLEGRLLRLAESYGIKREDFLEAYYGTELDPNWADKVAER